MEHMSAEIQNSSLIDLSSFILWSVDLGVVLNKITDSFNEAACFFLRFEVFLFR
jgi:hypothetical protein